MHTPNPQVVHARECVDSAEDAVCTAELTLTRRLQLGFPTHGQERFLQKLYGKLGEFRAKLGALEERYPEG